MKKASSCCAQLEWTTREDKDTITMRQSRKNTTTTRTSGKPPGCPAHLREIHPSLSHPCFLLWWCRRPSSSSSSCSSSGCRTRMERPLFDRTFLFKLADRTVSLLRGLRTRWTGAFVLVSGLCSRCWGCGGFGCPELRADWWSRSDAEDVANQQTASVRLCFLDCLEQEPQLLLPMVRSRKPTLNPYWAIWNRWQ